jgi:hypothetical protein
MRVKIWKMGGFGGCELGSGWMIIGSMDGGNGSIYWM